MAKLKLQPLKCNSCPARTLCQKYKVGADCWYEKNESAPDLSVPDGLLDLLESKLQLEWRDYLRAERLASILGNDPKDLVYLGNALSGTARTFAQLATIFGRYTPVRQPSGITVEQPKESAQIGHADNVQIIALLGEKSQRISDLLKEAAEHNVDVSQLKVLDGA